MPSHLSCCLHCQDNLTGVCVSWGKLNTEGLWRPLDKQMDSGSPKLKTTLGQQGDIGGHKHTSSQRLIWFISVNTTGRRLFPQYNSCKTVEGTESEEAAVYIWAYTCKHVWPQCDMLKYKKKLPHWHVYFVVMSTGYFISYSFWMRTEPHFFKTLQGTRDKL